jgi:hypothetical protein
MCDLAAALAGRPLPRVDLRPRDLKAARTNTLAALDHVGLLAELGAGAPEEGAAYAGAAAVAHDWQVGPGGVGVGMDMGALRFEGHP